MKYPSVDIASVATHVVDCLHSTPKFQDVGAYCVDTTCIVDGAIIWDKIMYHPIRLRIGYGASSLGVVMFFLLVRGRLEQHSCCRRTQTFA